MATQRLWIVIAVIVVLAVGAVFIYQSLNPESTQTTESSLIGDDYEIPSIGFAQVEGDYDWEFPTDYGVHPMYQREEWLLTTTGNCSHTLIANFSLLNIVPPVVPLDRESEWAVESVMTAQLTIREGDEVIVDKIADSRVALDLAGANSERVWIENWEFNWAKGTLSIVSTQDELDLKLTFAEPSVETVEGWYQYTLPVRLEGNFAFGDENATMSCDATLTHHFGTP